MSTELLVKANDRMQLGLRFHAENSDLYYFLSLGGFHFLHEHQYLEEYLTSRKLKKFMISHYGVSIPEFIPESANLIEPLIGKRKRESINSSERWDIIKQAWKAYVIYETETLKILEDIAKELENIGEVTSYLFIGDIVKLVNEELTEIKNMDLSFNLMDYDLPTIVEMQDTLEEKYEYRIRELYKEFKEWHHFNSK